ncbi:MAG: 30S ribosomal protein S17 [Candidatus Daviesbacteria bacterium GW2011_GWA2_38_24]|uniref:30S ribosomal protein S17 n=1 Tax=Candidatus Daviesbacteria bacterium GW2011_GWA2_38_24 TaxID=1618422 RepID=A0A0G0MR61_9BACT|nr:MAG: 30S ribosomal protein S17 [Candidatus Daviesbacteria bacterium GW2011_GWA2_38_24]KKQ78393.1 MAG: 30S ribosomal protein S17 [Candidatus Daviesbacteria bacterium GW2011_GWA1_38_7]OGE24521.1 MAG: 30S ribosomal protein S17 [Candidatus Daviesbacteria bacterium RIFCSPHIGHO2_01_FULL_38_8]
MIGRVVSTKMNKTVAVLVETRKRHPLYKKAYLTSKKYLVDDTLGVSEGDLVEIVKVKPISKRKHWKVTRVVGKDLVALGQQKLAKVAKETIEEVLPEEVQEVEAEKVEQEAPKKKRSPKKKEEKKSNGSA